MTRLQELLQVRHSETPMVALIAAMFLVTQSTHAFGANTADTLFFQRFGVENLPTMFILLGALSVVVTLSYGAGLARVDKRKLMPAVLAIGAGIMVAQRIGVMVDVPAIYPAIWLITNLVTLVTFTLMWNVAASVCDTRQAKRLFSVFAAAGILGGVVGNFSTGPLAAAIGAENLLIVIAALLFVSAYLTQRIGSRYIEPSPRRSAAMRIRDEIRSGYAYVANSRYLRMLALAAGASMVLFYAIIFPFSESAAAEFPTEAGLAAFLGTFSGIATVTAFLVSLLVAGRLYSTIGVVGSVFLLPVVYVAGLALWLVSFDLTAAAIVRGLQWVTIMGISSTAFNALFNVAPPERRPQVLSFVLGIAGQLGVSGAGVFLLLGSRLDDRRVVFATSLAIALAYGALVWRLRAQYATQLLGALRAGLLDPFDTAHRSVTDLKGHADVIAVVAAALEDEHGPTRRLAVEMLGRIESPNVLPLLERAIRDEVTEVRRAAVAALDRVGGRNAADLAARAFTDPEPSVRARAVATVSRHAPDPADRYLVLARDPAAEVRGRVAVALHNMGRIDEADEMITRLLGSDDPGVQLAGLDAARDCPGVALDFAATCATSERRDVRLAAVAVLAASDAPAARDALVAACRHPDGDTRDAAAEGLRNLGTTFSDVNPLLEQGSESARRAALQAITNVDDPSRLLGWARSRIDEAATLHHRAAVLGDGGAATRYLRRLVAAGEWDIERTILEALARADHRPALAIVERGLETGDTETKAQALEALDTVADRAFSKPLLTLLDSDGEVADATRRAAAFAQLAGDPQPFVRAVALLAGLEASVPGWDLHVAHAVDDPDPLVRETATRLGGASSDRVEPTMADTLDTLGTVERVLMLQEVPIFADLGADDLVAIADIATERTVGAGDLLVRRGDDADEMFLIVEGDLSVRTGTDEIAVRGRGEPIGELALLTHSTRSADVVADADARVLVIHADAFDAILTDRPAVTKALLGIVARRLAESA